MSAKDGGGDDMLLNPYKAGPFAKRKRLGGGAFRPHHLSQLVVM